MNGNLVKLSNWYNENLLTINSNKTKYVLFENSNRSTAKCDLPSKINGDRIGGANMYDDLGIKLDRNLNF